MKFIPDSIRRLFSRKSRKDKKAAPAVEAPAETPKVEEAPKPEPYINKYKAMRREELARFRTPDGPYVFSLEIDVPGRISPEGGQLVHMIRGRDADFLLALIGPSGFSQNKSVAMQIEEHMFRSFDIDIGKVWFMRTGDPIQDEKGRTTGKNPDFYMDGYDEMAGLPPGREFKMVLVPEDCDWQPDGIILPTHYRIPGTNTVTQHPAVLLQPYITPWKLININGYDVAEPRLPEIPGAQAEPVKKEEPKKEEPKEAVAVPASAVVPTPAPPQPKP
jgi:hypothetical protein